LEGAKSPNDLIVQVRDRTAAEKRTEEHLLAQRHHHLDEHLNVQCIINLWDQSEHFCLQEANIEELFTH
jgi:hypothetical protein